MQCGGLESMTGTIVADQTFIGGDPKNRHGGGRYTERCPCGWTPRSPGRGPRAEGWLPYKVLTGRA